MDETQVEHIEKQIDIAVATKDSLQIMTALALSLKTTAKCTAHTGERTKQMNQKLDGVLEIKSKVDELEKRVETMAEEYAKKSAEETELAKKVEQMGADLSILKKRESERAAKEAAKEAERRGATKMLKFLSGAGLIAGGALAAKLPELWKFICSMF